jgi:hypothetical protein
VAGNLPALPFSSTGPVDAAAAAPTRSLGRPLLLSTPWTADDVRLPARATAHPGMTPAGIVPVPRRRADTADQADSPSLARILG